MPVTGTLTPRQCETILLGGAGRQSSNSVRQYTVDGGKVDKVVDVDQEEVSLRCQFAVIDLTPPHTDTQRPVK